MKSDHDRETGTATDFGRRREGKTDGTRSERGLSGQGVLLLFLSAGVQLVGSRVGSAIPMELPSPVEPPQLLVVDDCGPSQCLMILDAVGIAAHDVAQLLYPLRLTKHAQ